MLKQQQPKNFLGNSGSTVREEVYGLIVLDEGHIHKHQDNSCIQLMPITSACKSLQMTFPSAVLSGYFPLLSLCSFKNPSLIFLL